MSLQILEGFGAAVRGLVSHNRLDGRNTELHVLVDDPIDQRISPDWVRGFTTLLTARYGSVNRLLVPRHASCLPRVHAIGPRLRLLPDQLLAEHSVWPHVPD